MLTPEDRARAVVTSFQGDNYWIDTEAAIVEVAEVIQAAVAEALMEELAIARTALDQIDRHIVGACASATGGMPDPCEECGEMREIAAQALAKMKKTREG